MTDIRIGVARRSAQEHLVAALRSQLATILADLAALNPGLALPAPADRAYYLGDVNDTLEVKQLANEPVSCHIWPASSRRLGATQSAGLNQRSIASDFDVQIVILFLQALGEPVTSLGRTLNVIETLQLRADRYAGALIECVYKYARDAHNIHDVKLIEDTSTAVVAGEERKLFGVASVRFTISQQALIPTKAPLP